MSGPIVWVVAGPSGAGKSTVGAALATAVGAALVDADDLHPPENVAKMRSGRPLTDADRSTWLATAAALVDERLATGRATVLAISALRHAHRRALGLDRPGIRAVWLSVAADELGERLEDRVGHFFPASLLDSQLATMEVPSPDEPIHVVDGTRPVADLVADLVVALEAAGGG